MDTHQGGGVVVVCRTDPQFARLISGGWRIVAQSWGARLRVPPPGTRDHAALVARLESLVAQARRLGYDVGEAGLADVERIAALEALTTDDYPANNAATAHVAPTVDDVRAMLAGDAGARAFIVATTASRAPRGASVGGAKMPSSISVPRTPSGASGGGAELWSSTPAGEVVAVTVTEPRGDRLETGFTSVHPAHRRRGLAAAVKAASVLAGIADGWAVFGTGGDAVNAGSLAMNVAVGYTIEEHWATLAPPV
jgi:hypothetical protein